MRDLVAKPVALLFFATFVSLFLRSIEVHGQDVRAGWSSPQVLGEGWWQSITVDRHGNAHIGWYGAVSGSDLDSVNELDALVYTSRLFNGSWTPVNDVMVTGAGGFTVRNALVVASDGMLYSAYRAGESHMFSGTYVTQAASAGHWRSPIPISGTGYYVDIGVDDNNTLHVIYSGREADIGGLPFSLEGDPCPLCFDLYYRRSSDGGDSWTPPLNLSKDQEAGSDRPEIRVGGSGRIYVDWDVGVDWYVSKGQPLAVRLLYSDDGGMTWSEPITLEGNSSDLKPTQIAVAELRNGRLLAVWRYHDDLDPQVYFQLSEDIGQTWTVPEPVPGVYARSAASSTLDDYELLTDILGNAHLFMVGHPDLDTNANPTLFHLQFRQDSWLPRERIFYSPDERPEWPRAALGPQGDIHLTWFVRGLAEGVTSFTSSTVGLRVYYSRLGPSLSNQPTQSFDPTRTPQSTPTLLRELVPTVTPLSPVTPFDGPVVSTSRDNYAAQVLVGGMVAVAVVCGGLIAFMRFWRR